ncbi:MAG: hypothetical protein CGW95_01000 [Phenylobacterium zucineum]|nr:MAG: hypothetical protein CGW95_01000 [Phenylobacterium zucineum]
MIAFETYDWSSFRFVGRPDNIDAAQDTLAFVLLQVEALYKSHLPKGLSKQARAEFRRSFKDACSHRVYERCAKIVEEQTQKDNPSTGSTALVVIEHRKQLKLEVDDYLKAAGARTIKSRSVSVKLNEGYLRGRLAGDHVELNRTIKEIDE